MRSLDGALFAIVLAMAGTAMAQVPTTIGYNGVLNQSFVEPQAMTFRLCDSKTTGNCPWEEIYDGDEGRPDPIAIVDGFFHVELGSQNPLTAETLLATPWLELQIGTQAPVAERMDIRSPVLFAQVCGKAETVITVPGGSGDYIQNQSVIAQNAEFNISGNGVFGGNVGINTTTPGANLGIRSSGNGTVLINAMQSASDNPVFRVIQDSVGAGIVQVFDGNGSAGAQIPGGNGSPTYLGANGGNVGIGTTNPDSVLTVQGTGGQSAEIVISDGSPGIGFRDTEDNHDNFMIHGDASKLVFSSTVKNDFTQWTGILRIQAGGTVDVLAGDLTVAHGTIRVGPKCAPDSTWPDCSADLAELFATGTPVAAGSVVSLDLTSPKTVNPSAGSYDPLLMGVVSSNPTIVMGQQDAPNGIPVALAGVVPVKVTLDNGPIAVGDLLTSSSTPGHAMRADRPGPTVGKAMEAFDGSAGWQGSIRILVAPSAFSMPSCPDVQSLAERTARLETENRSLRRDVESLKAALRGLQGD